MLGWYFNDDPGLSEVNSNSVISKGDGNEGYIYRWGAEAISELFRGVHAKTVPTFGIAIGTGE